MSFSNIPGSSVNGVTVANVPTQIVSPILKSTGTTTVTLSYKPTPYVLQNGDGGDGGATPPFYFYELMLVGPNPQGNLDNLVRYLNLKYNL